MGELVIIVVGIGVVVFVVIVVIIIVMELFGWCFKCFSNLGDRYKVYVEC